MSKMYCDNCGKEVHVWVVVVSLPADVSSANKGESAILCLECHEDLITLGDN